MLKLLSMAVPQLGLALKIGPWVVIGLLGLAVWVEHGQIVTARAQTALAQSQTTLAVTKCQQEAASEAAAESAASAKQVAAAEAAANSATAQLMAVRKAADATAAEAADALTSSYDQIDKQAAVAGQDGPIPPVLAEMFP